MAAVGEREVAMTKNPAGGERELTVIKETRVK